MRSVSFLRFAGLAAASTPASGDDVAIESFSSPRLSWTTTNDPVMGGRSTSEFHVDDSAGVGVFDGRVEIVPSLQAPGFINLEASGRFPDVSACQALALVVNSTTSDYQGYRVSFGTKHDPASWMPWIRGFKTHMSLEPAEGVQTVTLPFANFTLKWDPATGDALEACADNAELCPDAATLRDMEKLSIMGEGVAGRVHLEIESIAATGCSGAEPSAPLTSAA